MSSLKYGKFEMPEKINIEEQAEKENFAKFIAEPFGRGFAHTIGNSLRRVLLSSLEAPAIISIRIEGVHHEYMSIEGVVEDMTNIVLNIKGALLRRMLVDEDPLAHEPRILTYVLDVTQDDIDANKGKYSVTLGDIVKDSAFEVVNPDLHLFTVTKPFRKQVDLRVAIGRGYVPSERHSLRDKTADEILVDAAFSPVRIVNYYVENTRVGQDTDFDRLILEITTDGRLSAVEALSFAAQISSKHFDVFNKIKAYSLNFDEAAGEGDADVDEMMEKLALRIDEIELSVRSTNCLSGANIETIAELVSIPERKMLEFRNFGKKSLNEIKAKLVEMGLHLGMDLNRYGITQDNVKEKIRQYQEEKKGRNKQREKEEER
jgi:DNA-directed RNA polymerase subunit alpha